jgi:putative transcriptional regulator
MRTRRDRTDLARLRAMTDEEVEKAARSDTEALPLSARRLARMRPVAEVDVKALRERLDLSQAQFAKRFGFALKTVQDWEQHRRKPVGPARVLLNMIARDPRRVERLAAAAT